MRLIPLEVSLLYAWLRTISSHDFVTLGEVLHLSRGSWFGYDGVKVTTLVRPLSWSQIRQIWKKWDDKNAKPIQVGMDSLCTRIYKHSSLSVMSKREIP
jgi:hypothetical protein